ncbi:type-2 ice-structuring protein-like [Tachysurus fulvidraco]|uniref:type-2 ice-structuring protein-like n=1 Tax=Tachysurus fulvidraco TaxID=1234273 RepID=UPI001FED4523|nr:type-2 ice-structuring protein-like [Tachysurus fulvidraco]
MASQTKVLMLLILAIAGATLAAHHTVFDPTEALTYIGLSDCQKAFQFFWSDGTKLTFTKWRQGQPDNYENRERCVHINAGASKNWNDINCENRYASVCAKESY